MLDNIVIAITTHNGNSMCREAIEATWLNNLDLPHVFVYAEQPENKTNSVNLQGVETYEALAYKTYKLVKWFLDTEYDGLLKIDDDTYLNCNKLGNIKDNIDYAGFMMLSRNLNYTYHQGKCSDVSLNEYCHQYYDDHLFAAGGCYYLSRRACELIVERFDDRYVNDSLEGKLTLEDRMVGKLLSGCDIQTQSSGYWINKKMFRYSVMSDMAFHPITPDQMSKIKGCNLTRFTYNNIIYEASSIRI